MMMEKVNEILLSKNIENVEQLLVNDFWTFVELLKLLAKVFDCNHTYEERQAVLAKYSHELAEAMIAVWSELPELCMRDDKRSGDRLNAVAEAACEHEATLYSLVEQALISYARYAFSTKELFKYHKGNALKKEKCVCEGVAKVKNNMPLFYSKKDCHRVGYVYAMFRYAAIDLVKKKKKDISVGKKTAVSLEVLHDKGSEPRSSEDVEGEAIAASSLAAVYDRLSPDDRRYVAVSALKADYYMPTQELEEKMMQRFHLHAPLAEPKAIKKGTVRNNTTRAKERFKAYLYDYCMHTTSSYSAVKRPRSKFSCK